ncbi:MAG: class I SAM-dependent methyltransferase [Thermoplasmata archaeon]
MFDKLAPFYDSFSEIFLPDLKEYILDRTELEEKDKVLDVGGGTGQLMNVLSRIESTTRGYVIDRSKKMLSQANPNIDVILGDVSYLPFDSNTFDLVLCIDAFHHFERKDRSLDEMIRVLKDRGEVMILELEEGNPITGLVEKGERLFGEPTNFYEEDEIAEIFLEKGFEVKIEKINFFQYVLYAKRGDRESIKD